MSKLLRWCVVTTTAVISTALISFAFTDSRPYAWCGWYMRHLVHHDPGTSFNMARNWAHWGYGVNQPHPGAVVVWPHHVGKIVRYAGNGLWFVHSGNDGHAVKTRARSLAGAIAFRVDPAEFSPRESVYQVASTETKEVRTVAKHTHAKTKVHPQHYANIDSDYLFQGKVAVAQQPVRVSSRVTKWLFY